MPRFTDNVKSFAKKCYFEGFGDDTNMKIIKTLIFGQKH